MAFARFNTSSASGKAIARSTQKPVTCFFLGGKPPNLWLAACLHIRKRHLNIGTKNGEPNSSYSAALHDVDVSQLGLKPFRQRGGHESRCASWFPPFKCLQIPPDSPQISIYFLDVSSTCCTHYRLSRFFWA